MKTLTNLFLSLILTGNTAIAQQFHPLGPGLNDEVHAITAHGTDIYVGGDFTDAGGDPDADYLARWDGSTWHAVVGGLNRRVRTIAVHDNRIYVGGDFIDVGGNTHADHIAYADNGQWKALGNGLPNIVYSIALDDDRIYAGGIFPGKIVSWDGQNWKALGGGLNSTVYTVKVKGSDVYVGGTFINAGDNFKANQIARWNGWSWKALGNGLNLNGVIHGTSGVRDILFYKDDIYVLGGINLGGTYLCETRNILRWDGTKFNSLGDKKECRWFYRMCHIGNYLYVGVIDHVSGDAGVHRWDMARHTWKDFIASWVIHDYFVEYGDMALASSGANLFVGHSFDSLGGVDMNYQSSSARNIAQWRDPDIDTTALPISEDDPSVLYVFPNPTHDFVFYCINNGVYIGSHTITLIDVKGASIFSRESTVNHLDISHLPAGMYIMEITMPGVHAYAKVLKVVI